LELERERSQILKKIKEKKEAGTQNTLDDELDLIMISGQVQITNRLLHESGT